MLRLFVAAVAALTFLPDLAAHGPLRRVGARLEAAFPRMTAHLPLRHAPASFPVPMPGPGHVTHPAPTACFPNGCPCTSAPGGVGTCGAFTCPANGGAGSCPCAAPQAAPAAKFVPVPGAKVAAADPPVVGAPRLRIGKRIAEFRAGVKAELEKRGFDPSDVHIVGQLGDGKLLEWIITHGPDIIKFVEMLIALFGGL